MKNQAKAYQKQLVAIKKDTAHLKGKYKEYIKQIHEKDRQIQQLKSMLSRSSEKKSQYEEFMNQMHEKDRQIQEMKYILGQYTEKESLRRKREHHSGPDFPATMVRGSNLPRSSLGQLRHQGPGRSNSSISTPSVIRQRSCGPGLSRSRSGHLDHHQVSARLGSSRSTPAVIRSRPGCFQDYVLKKEKGEMTQEQDLLNRKHKKNPIVHD